jgi:hypothetical protein
MPRYDDRRELAPRDIVARSIQVRAAAGRGLGAAAVAPTHPSSLGWLLESQACLSAAYKKRVLALPNWAAPLSTHTHAQLVPASPQHAPTRPLPPLPPACRRRCAGGARATCCWTSRTSEPTQCCTTSPTLRPTAPPWAWTSRGWVDAGAVKSGVGCGVWTGCSALGRLLQAEEGVCAQAAHRCRDLIKLSLAAHPHFSSAPRCRLSLA